MIGTTFKLGFDGSSVSKGLGNLSRTMARGFGRIGVGALERVGHRVTDLFGRILMAAPEAIQETADWAGGLTDMATATGTSVESLVLLEEKFRLAGVRAKETGAVVSRFGLNLKTAMTEGGPAKDALNKLGFYATEFKDLNLDQSFEKIAKRISEMAPQLENVEGIMADLFGAKLGYQQLKLFRDYAAVSERASRNVGDFAKKMNSGLAGQIDEWGEALERFETLKRQLSTIAIDELMNAFGGAGGPDAFFDSFNPENWRGGIRTITDAIKNILTNPTQFFGDALREAGRMLGEGFKESFSLKGLLPQLLPSNAQNSREGQQNAMLGIMRDQKTLLTQIRDRSVAKFA